MTEKEIKQTEPNRFPKEVLLKAAVFENNRDALGVVISDGEVLTVEEAQLRLDKFMKGKVK